MYPPMQDHDSADFPEVELSVDPHAEAERLYDDFYIELDPIRDQSFFRRLAELEPAQWESLDVLCENLAELPNNAREIIDMYPGRFVLCHLPWIGRRSDENQPYSVILAGDIVSMYHRAMLMNVLPSSTPPNEK